MTLSKVGICCGIAMAALLALANPASAQRQMERLGRGVVAVNQGEGKAFVSWRRWGPNRTALRSMSTAPQATVNPSSSTPSRYQVYLLPGQQYRSDQGQRLFRPADHQWAGRRDKQAIPEQDRG